MRKLSAFWESFYSGNLYSEAFLHWKGIGALFILFLAFLQSIVLILIFHSVVSHGIKHEAPPIADQIPVITFADGKASTPEAKAYEIKAPDSGEVFGIIDTRGDNPPHDLGGAQFFLAGRSLTYQKDLTESRNYNYEGWTFVLDRPLIDKCLAIVNSWAAIFIFPFVLGFLIVYRLLQLLFFSLITLLVCKILGVQGGYGAILRITALALVPPLLLNIVASGIGLDFYGISLLFFMVVLGYIVFGVHSVKALSSPPNLPPPVPPAGY